MSETTCDLRVLIRFNDGTVGAYAVDGIPSASRLRDELSVAAGVFGDPEVRRDCLPGDELPGIYGQVFREVQSALTLSQ